MGNVKVPVIIPVYNVEKYLRQCMDSILNQTLNDIEIICVDAGSTDASVQILEQYALADSRVTVIKDKGRLDAGSARNIGLDVAKGEFLSFLDSDDFFEQDMLEKAYTEAVCHNGDIVVFESDYYSDQHKKYIPNYFTINRDLTGNKKQFSAQQITKNVFRVFTGWAWDKLFRTEFVKKYNLTYQQQRTTNDMLFVFTAQLLAEKIIVMDELLAHHRLTEHTLSVTREKSWHCFYDALTALKETLEKYELYDRYERDYINYCVHFSLWHLNTLKMPAHQLLYNKLKNEWYDSMGVTEHSKNYFYNLKEYTEYCNIYRYDYGCLPAIKKFEHRVLQVYDLMGRIMYVFRLKGPAETVRWIKLMKMKIGK